MPAGGKGQGKGKGKVRVEVCMFDDETQAWVKKSMPSQAVSHLIANEAAVYPVDGACPIDPPIVVDDGDDPEPTPEPAPLVG